MISLTKKLLSVALAVVLLLGAFPATVSAAGEGEFDVNFYASKADFENGKPALATVPVKANTPVDLTKAPTAPAVTGMTATGNWIFCVHGTVYAAGTNIVDNTNLYPEYTKNPEKAKYQVSFNTNCEVANPATQMVEDGTAITLPTLKREGYTLTLWTGAGKPGDSFTVTENVTLTAEWKRNEYTVRFIGADGKSFKEFLVRHGETVPAVPSLSEAGSRDGMKAHDWDGDPYAPITADTDFKALYEANQYTVTFDPNNSKLSKDSKTVTYGKKIGKMPVYELQDHVPGGWFYNGTEYTNNSIYDFNHDITLTMKWIPEARVELHIYRNGKTSSAYTEPPVYGVAENSILYMSDIDIADYYKGSKSFKVEGIYDPIGWRAYKAGENPKPIEKIQTIPRDQGITELYVMVTDTNQPAETTKPTTKPADPSNPQTGDESMIIATSAAMLISAGALAYIVYDRKRRMA